MGMFENLQASRESVETGLPSIDDPVVSLEMEIDADFDEAEQGLALPAEIEAIQAVEAEMQNLRDVAAVAQKHGNSRALISFVNRDHGLEKILGMEAEDIVNLESDELAEKIETALEAFEENLEYMDATFAVESMGISVFDLEISEEATRTGQPVPDTSKAVDLKNLAPRGAWNKVKFYWGKVTARLRALMRQPGRLWNWMKGKAPSFPSAKLGFVKGIPGKMKGVAGAGWDKAKGAGSAVAGASSKTYHMFASFVVRNKVMVAIGATAAVVGGIGVTIMARRRDAMSKIDKYKSAISGKSWNDEDAGSKTMKGIPEANVMKELATANALQKVFSAAFEQSPPVTESEYKAYSNKVAAAMKPFTEVYGLTINWNQEAPSASRRAVPDTHILTKNTAKDFGYGSGSFAKISGQLIKSIDMAGRSVSEAEKKFAADVESTTTALEKAGDEAGAGPGGTKEWAEAVAYCTSAIIGGSRAYSVCANALVKHSIPKTTGILGGLTKYYK